MRKNYQKTTSLALCAMFTALMILGAFIRIPTPLVAITLQFWFCIMAGLLLGPWRGSLSVLIYLLLGLIGLPVFTQGSGPAYIFQPTFGYLLGFVLGAWLTGRIAWSHEQADWKWLLLACFAGLVVVYAIGTLYCYLISRFVLGTTLAMWPLLVSCVFLPIPKDIIFCFLSAFLAKRLLPQFRKYQ